MNNTNEIIEMVTIATILKGCPFCANRAVVEQAAAEARFGVRCSGCPACLSDTFQSCEEAITVWCKRRGSVAAAGGAATRGRSSWKKKRSSRKNLRKAREQKKLKRIKLYIQAALAFLKPFRAAEIHEAEQMAAAWCGALKEHESTILADPMLHSIYNLVQKGQRRRHLRAAAPEEPRSICQRSPFDGGGGGGGMKPVLVPSLGGGDG